MEQKQRTLLVWIGCIFGGVLLISLTAWIFREDITSLITESRTSTQTEASQQGVARKTSYLGRLREAETLLMKGMNSRAAIELSVAISEKPEIMRPYLLLGEVYLRTQDFTKLQGLITELDKRFPEAPEIKVLRARVLIAKEDFQAAQTFLQDTDTNLLEPGLQLYQAALAGLQNNHKKAQELLSQLNKLPIKTELILEGNKTSQDTKEKSMSPELAEKVSALLEVYENFAKFTEGENPHLFALLAKALAENNEPTLARAFADVSIREDISYVDAWMLRGYANFLLGNNNLALEDLRHAYRLDPVRPEVEYFLALTLEKSGKTTEAALFYEKLLTREFPYQTEVRWKLIELLTAQKEMDRVVELYQKQAKIAPAPGKFVSAVHTLLNVLNKPEEALTLTQEILSQQPENVLALNLRAWALIENKQFVEAENLLEKAEELNPENPRTQLNFGLLEERQGDPVAAREYYKKCYELGQNQPYNSVVELAVKRYNELLSLDLEAKRKVSPHAP